MYVSNKIRNPNRFVHDYMIGADSTQAGWRSVQVPFPKDMPGAKETDVFLALQGTSTTQANRYNLCYVHQDGAEDSDKEEELVDELTAAQIRAAEQAARAAEFVEAIIAPIRWVGRLLTWT